MRRRKEENEREIEKVLLKEAHARDFKTFLKLLMQAELIKHDRKLKYLEEVERRRRKQAFEQMDPLARDLMEEANRFKYLYNAAMGRSPEEGDGEPRPMEDMMVNMLFNRMLQE